MSNLYGGCYLRRRRNALDEPGYFKVEDVRLLKIDGMTRFRHSGQPRPWNGLGCRLKDRRRGDLIFLTNYEQGRHLQAAKLGRSRALLRNTGRFGAQRVGLGYLQV